MTGANVFEGLQWVVGEVAGRLYYYSASTPSNSAPRDVTLTQTA